MRALALLLGGCLVACSSGGADASPDAGSPNETGTIETGSTTWAVAPGTGMGELRVGDDYASIKAKLGKADTETGFNRLVFGRWSARKLEIVFASSSEDSVSDDARVLALAVRAGAEVDGPARPGRTRAELVAALGAPSDELTDPGPASGGSVGNSILYWPSGLAAQLDADGIAQQVAVFPAYVPETTVAEMEPSKGSVSKATTIDAAVVAKIGAVDMHLHPGRFGRIPPSTRKFIVRSLPAFTQLYAPGALAPALDPYAPFVGIKAQTELAKVDHALLFAVYTQKTTGWQPNEELEALLTDPRNVAADGLPWAWGLASIDFFDGFVKDDGTVDPVVEKRRLDAIASYFEKRRDLFVGIKLAHPHQQVAFDDPRFLGVYGVAARYGVPVYVHTGFSPFENAKNERAFYDPEGLRNVIKNNPKVKFVLGHVGQGDALAVEHCLSLAQELPNVFLEVSALNRPIQRDLDGKDVPADSTKPLYPYVLSEVKKRGLVDKTLFGTDGPQYAGMVRNYVGLLTKSMKEQGFTDDEVAKVMVRNFFAVFFGTA